MDLDLLFFILCKYEIKKWSKACLLRVKVVTLTFEKCDLYEGTCQMVR